MDNLFSVPGENFPLAQGISPGLDPIMGPLWYDGENIRFRFGKVQRIDGTALFYTPDPLVMGVSALSQTFAENKARIFIGHDDGVIVLEDALGAQDGYHLIRTHPEGAPEEGDEFPSVARWNLEPWGTWLIAGEVGGRIFVWKDDGSPDEGGALTYLPTDFITAKLLTKLGPHLIAGNLSGGGVGTGGEITIAWSGEDDVEDWDYSGNGGAGDLPLRDLDSPLVAFCPLGDSVAVYTKDMMGVLFYIGTPLYFGFNSRLNGIGAVGGRSVTAVGPYNYGLGQNGFWRTDGVGFEYLDEAVKDWFIERMNWSQAEKVQAISDEIAGEIVWHYPEVGKLDNSAWISVNTRTGLWQRGTLSYPAVIERQVLRYPLAADREGRLYTLNEGKSVLEDKFDSWLVSRPLAMGTPEINKFLQEMELAVQGTGLSFDIYAFDEEEDLEDLDYDHLERDGELIYTGNGRQRVHTDIEREAPYFVLRFHSSAPDADWKLSSFRLRGIAGGFSRWP